jgi:spermidine synthase
VHITRAIDPLQMRKYLYLTVFISGMTTLAIEMTAERLLGSVFGTSNLVWASIIGLVLIYLSFGYFLGGFLSDRYPHFRVFYQLLIWASILVSVSTVISRPVLRLASQAFDDLQLGPLFGSFAVVLLLFAVPVTLMGTASPFAIRLAVHDTRSIGSTSGRIYAISTFGSFIGTFLPVLILIPPLGTYRTLIVLSAILLLTALYGLVRSSGWRAALPYAWAPLLLLFLFWKGLPGTDRTAQGMIFETESSYNYIQVLEQDGFRTLRLNEGQGIHSIYHPEQLVYGGPWEMVLAAPFFNAAPYDPGNLERIAIIGLAAGTTARQATEVFGPIQIDGYEIDPKIVEAGQEYFDMNQENLNVYVADGRWGLAHSPHRYDVISVDAYRPPYIPWHMTTQEFFQIVHDHLTDDGVMVINVGRSPEDRRLINTLASTIRTVFPTIYAVDIPDTFNTMLYATVQPTEADNLRDNILYLHDQGSASPLLMYILGVTASNLQPEPDQDQVFTDDHAPIEWITNTMVLRFLLSGDVETIQ